MHTDTLWSHVVHARWHLMISCCSCTLTPYDLMFSLRPANETKKHRQDRQAFHATRHLVISWCFNQQTQQKQPTPHLELCDGIHGHDQQVLHAPWHLLDAHERTPGICTRLKEEVPGIRAGTGRASMRGKKLCRQRKPLPARTKEKVSTCYERGIGLARTKYTYTVYIRHFGQENHQIYGQMWCILYGSGQH